MKKLFIGLVTAALFAVTEHGRRTTDRDTAEAGQDRRFQNAAVLSGETSVYLDPKANLNQDYVTGC